jgi:hypothetical protein
MSPNYELFLFKNMSRKLGAFDQRCTYVCVDSHRGGWIKLAPTNRMVLPIICCFLKQMTCTRRSSYIYMCNLQIGSQSQPPLFVWATIDSFCHTTSLCGQLHFFDL